MRSRMAQCKSIPLSSWCGTAMAVPKHEKIYCARYSELLPVCALKAIDPVMAPDFITIQVHAQAFRFPPIPHHYPKRMVHGLPRASAATSRSHPPAAAVPAGSLVAHGLYFRHEETYKRSVSTLSLAGSSTTNPLASLSPR